MAAGLGCRKPLTPNIDRNEAPETWITAAPLDTLTVKDNYLRPIGKPSLTTIPVRFHLYWAGSDRDGAVAGFYYAVVETTAAPTDGGFAPLPGPKPGEYRFTTKTDTTFIFTVSELLTDRQHAFFIYAVDNQGKPDPTPARFIFNAIDKFPPKAIIESAVATGTIVGLTRDGDPVPTIGQYFVTDVNSRLPARDTVPANSRMDFTWHGEITQAGTYVASYRYKLDESKFVVADSSVHTATYGTGPVPISPGLKVFTLRALDQAGGGVDSTRRFIMNFDPDTWWAGPDPADFTGPSDLEYNSHSVDVLSWPSQRNPVFTTNPPLPPGSTFGADSLSYRPSKRFPPNRDFTRPGTFYEVYKDRLYARTEGDTVHMNSYVILWNGGYDKDSRYVIRADRDSLGPTDPTLQLPNGTPLTGPVVDDAGQVGSPIGFRSLIVPRLTPAGIRGVSTQTSMYPVWSPSSVGRSPSIGGYWRMFQAGKFYAVARGEDPDGGLDQAVSDPVKLADQEPNSPLRRKVLVFYVDKAPALITDGLFRPSPGQSIDTAQWDFFLRGMDLDPFDATVVSPATGGPTANTVIRFKVTLFGKSLDGRDTSWTYLERSAGSTAGQPYVLRGTDVALSFIPGGTMAANPFASGPILVSIQICDCSDCENAPGAGRCVEGVDSNYLDYPRDPGNHVLNQQNVITVNYTRPAGAPGLVPTSSTAGRPGPDSSGRRD